MSAEDIGIWIDTLLRNSLMYLRRFTSSQDLSPLRNLHEPLIGLQDRPLCAVLLSSSLCSGPHLSTSLVLPATTETATEAATKSSTAEATAKPTLVHLGHGAVGVHDATGGGHKGCRAHRKVVVGVDAESDPRKQAVGETVAGDGVADDGVVAIGALHEQEVGSVFHHTHLVGAVWIELVDSRQETLVEIELADMGGFASGDGIVGLLLGTQVDNSYRLVRTPALAMAFLGRSAELISCHQ